jgi:uncharacterized repeat protein (TIGR04138 family)
MPSFEEVVSRILAKDRRYTIEAYAFAAEGLDHALELREEAGQPRRAPGQEPREEDHITGPELCAAIRDLALNRYGMLAGAVLRGWGIACTRDVGNVVFNLVEGGAMRKREEDRVEDFDNCFDFGEAFSDGVELIP